jgi:4-hydroxy-2-oxoheptanedioate aldolase
MQLPRNTFKDALRAARLQIRLWLGLAHAYATEFLPSTGFDWLAIDAEHARATAQRLGATAAWHHTRCRPWCCHLRRGAALQYLDIAQTLLVPTVESAAQALSWQRAIRLRGFVAWAAPRPRLALEPDRQLPALPRPAVRLSKGVAAAQNLPPRATAGVDGVFWPRDLAASLLGRPADACSAAITQESKPAAGGEGCGRAERGSEPGASYLTQARVRGVGVTLLRQAAPNGCWGFKSPAAAQTPPSGAY